MTRQRNLSPTDYWPQVGLVLGLVMTAVGLVGGSEGLIASGSNVLTVCGLFLAQRRRNDRRD